MRVVFPKTMRVVFPKTMRVVFPKTVGIQLWYLIIMKIKCYFSELKGLL